jgi:hypothetical protein
MAGGQVTRGSVFRIQYRSKAVHSYGRINDGTVRKKPVATFSA